jgi:8-oxo-dGTP diphosphatase
MPSITVDTVIFTVREGTLEVLLVKRKNKPYQGMWAIPGGFVKEKEDLVNAAQRELKEETGVNCAYLEQLYTFGNPKRDPRGRVITVAYFALIDAYNLQLVADTDAADAKWFPVYHSLPENLAFDHKEILDYAIKRLKWKCEYTTVAFSLLLEEFTLSDIQSMYEVIFNKQFDKRNFRKKILSLDLIEPINSQTEGAHRPAQLYKLKREIGEIVEIL